MTNVCSPQRISSFKQYLFDFTRFLKFKTHCFVQGVLKLLCNIIDFNTLELEKNSIEHFPGKAYPLLVF